MPKTRRLLTLAALAAVVIFAYYAASATPVISDQNYTYIAELEWYNTYDAGAEAALKEKKPLMVYFWTIWCVYCEKYHKEVFSREDIRQILAQDFVRVAIDMDVNKEDTRRFNVAAPPHVIFMTYDGEIITRVPGYMPADEFKRVLLSVKARASGGAGQ
ncbi:MAG: thioredoxin family protein [Euryarchaeota archaeon]|nr:thioredoxin family protein [Euryarchaeota archaeon]